MSGHTLRSVADLSAAGLIARTDEAALAAVAERYTVTIPPAFAALIEPGNPADPIGLQTVPDPAELHAVPGEQADPIGDAAHAPLRGLVHRYPDRVLLTPGFACAVYCRFCFRRERVGPGGGEQALSPEELTAAFDYIRARPNIREVILTGGDPLVLAPRRLAAILQTLDAIPSLGHLRIHSRVPMAAPERITDELLAALHTTKALFIAIHANHPREFTPAARTALRRLAGAGIPLLSQSVLLRGVNDDGAVLAALMRCFVENRVKPYYLHHLDAAPGTARFKVSIAEGQALVRALRGRVSGLCQPAYVLDIPGGHGKSPLESGWISPDGAVIRDWQGRSHFTDVKG
ncbi:MAG: lysine-2,3-aminomutase-like protein [Rhodospirillaceae bacterium]